MTSEGLLPPELKIEMFKAHFGVCALRRHCLAHLQNMHLTVVGALDVEGGYTSHAHDQHIRRTAGMDYHEKAYYRFLRTRFLTISRWWARMALGAERDWLQNPPMDFRTFPNLCANGTNTRNGPWADIVIELFPGADFIDPPPELGNNALFPLFTAVVPTRRLQLQQRTAPNSFAYITRKSVLLDSCIYSGLIHLWKSEFLRLPIWVKSVKMIIKDPVVPHLGFRVEDLAADAVPKLCRVLEDINGRNVFGGSIMRRRMEPSMYAGAAIQWTLLCCHTCLRQSRGCAWVEVVARMQRRHLFAGEVSLVQMSSDPSFHRKLSLQPPLTAASGYHLSTVRMFLPVQWIRSTSC